MAGLVSPAPRPTPPRGYVRVIRTIDRFTELSGYVFLIVLVPLIFANVVEVFARYVLRDPTVWALEVTTMSYAVLLCLLFVQCVSELMKRLWAWRTGEFLTRHEKIWL